MAVRKRTWRKPNGEIGEAWVADYKANGKRHIKTFPTRKEAVAFSNKTGVEISEGRHVADSVSITVADAAAIWIKAVELGRGDNPPAEHSTLRQYRSHLKHHILPAIGKVKAQSTHAVERVRLPRPSSHQAIAPDGEEGSSLVQGHLIGGRGRAAVSWATWRTRSGSATRDDTRSPSLFPRRPRSRPSWRSSTSGQRTRHWRRWRALFATAIYSGFRASELRGLPWDAVDLKAGTITVKQRADERGVIGSPKTVASRRTISIPSFLVTMLRNGRSNVHAGSARVRQQSRGNVQTLSDIHERAWRPLQRSRQDH